MKTYIDSTQRRASLNQQRSFPLRSVLLGHPRSIPAGSAFSARMYFSSPIGRARASVRKALDGFQRRREARRATIVASLKARR